MLRFDFLPSDFHPRFLILGERADLRELATVLEQVADTGEPGRWLHPSSDGSEPVQLRISRVEDPRGLRQAGPCRFDWELSGELALAFAQEVASVAQGQDPAGSVVLTVRQFDLDEIPVWISQGEFTDGYLVDSF